MDTLTILVIVIVALVVVVAFEAFEIYALGRKFGFWSSSMRRLEDELNKAKQEGADKMFQNFQEEFAHYGIKIERSAQDGEDKPKVIEAGTLRKQVAEGGPIKSKRPPGTG